jgi:transcriptional regulator with XRE-family HTH domain
VARQKRSESDKIVGERIGRLCQQRGLKSAAVAAQLGISRQQVEKYWNGQSIFSLALIMRLATLLRCSPLKIIPVELTEDASIWTEIPDDDATGMIPDRWQPAQERPAMGLHESDQPEFDTSDPPPGNPGKK